MIGNFLDFTKRVRDGFTINQHRIRPYEFFDNVHIAITYELDPDYYQSEVHVYNALDMLGDIGGLQYSLVIVLSSILMLMHHNKMENYLVSQMFHVVNAKSMQRKMGKVGLNKGKVTDVYDNGLDPKKLSYCREIYHACKRDKG